ncbi:hypothetical protein K458DRAFT_328271 [Lentithecium fluviatile CBS 122367]|uniref:Uncharacterized protein n=1 Tax=Lentithecium fluviatile CBS 122367 TaxID=1168545 RepID=A0A6G1JIW0_9PLEO|nr:hypothetical protein K458DRAFT_328271 [Lentithecium fluviatile CBS 122367]
MDLDASSPATDEDQTSAPVVREFICKNDEFAECKTGQYTMDLSRKVISDHFGRNKACTRIIKNWPLFCRKHYQRATYNQEKWQLRKVALIIRQFYIIEEQFPGTMYTVALKKSEENRLNTFSRKVASGMEPEEASKYVEPRENKHFEAPIDVLRELSMDLGSNKNVTEVDQIVNNIHDMLVNHETKQVPSIEFLPQLDADGTPYVEDDGSSPSKGKSPKKPRVNKKGGIQKPATPKKASKA